MTATPDARIALEQEIAQLRIQLRLLIPTLLNTPLPSEVVKVSHRVEELMRRHSAAWKNLIALGS